MQKINPEVKITNIPERDIDNIRRRSVDIEKIHQTLGWAPEINVKRGIEITYEWYKSFLNSN